MKKKSLGETLLRIWKRSQKIPFGKIVVSRYLGIMIPYTGTIKATIVSLDKGAAKVQLKPKRQVYNHLRSVHAIALANLGEFATGLALITASPSDAKSILVGFHISYLKKARGVLQVSAKVSLPQFDYELEHEVKADIVDTQGDVVASIVANWKLRKVD